MNMVKEHSLNFSEIALILKKNILGVQYNSIDIRKSNQVNNGISRLIATANCQLKTRQLKKLHKQEMQTVIPDR